MPTRCNRCFLLQILLLAQHVSGTITPTGDKQLYNTLELLMMGIMVPKTCCASNKICNKKTSVASGLAFYFHILNILFLERKGEGKTFCTHARQEHAEY
jgi:hypothetical protein